jgi:hypothetical protein
MAIGLATGLGLILAATGGQGRPETRVVVVEGLTGDGRATDLWLTVLRRRLDPGAFDSVARIVHPLTLDEGRWSDTARAHAARWADEVPALVTPFDPISGPESVTVVVGNRGSEDAFTHDSLTIGFDLSALLRVYGPVDSGDNPQKLDRFFRHEFTHTLQKRWLARRPFLARTALESALLDIWLEGLGNYYSLGPKWQPTDARPSMTAAATLARLEPEFVERLSGLACADSIAARPLLKGLSSGPFDRKWGAVTAALWLQDGMTRSQGTLRAFVAAGPAGVWALAERHLAREQVAVLETARRRDSSCR